MDTVGRGNAMNSDLLYFARRAREERAAANLAANDRARRSHLEMANAYEARVRDLQAKTKFALHIVEAA